MRAYALLVMLILGSSIAAANVHAEEQERRIALVIGNAAYQSAPTLAHPQNDARALGSALEELGFETDVRLDLDQRGLQKALREFGFEAQTADFALFYYAGFGLQAAGENYLLPIDAQLRRERDLIYESMPLTVVLGEVSLARKAGIVILDAARDNPLAESLRRALGPIRSRIVGNGLAAVKALPADTLVGLSARPGEVTRDGEGEIGPYARVLLATIAEPGLELERVFQMVRERVIEATGGQQEPASYDSLGIEPVYLVPPRPNRPPRIGRLVPLVLSDDRASSQLPLPAVEDPDEDPLEVEVTGLPDYGRIEAAGRPVEVGDRLSVAELGAAVYRAGSGFSGQAGAFAFLVTDDRGGRAAGKLPIVVERANRPPRVARPGLFQLPRLPLGIAPPQDPDGDDLIIRVDQVPEIGTIRDGDRIIVPGDELTLAEFARLSVLPRGNRVLGTFAYAAIDARGASLSSALEFDLGPARLRPADGGAAQGSPGAVNGGSPHRPPFEPFRVARTANVRSAPSADAGRITTLRSGTVVKVFDQTSVSGWYEIETLEGERGFIYGELVDPVPEAERSDLDPELRAGVQKASAVPQTLSAGMRDCPVCPHLVPVPGGTFVMGTDSGHPSERPAHRVTIEPFAIGRNEVTVRQWRACVDGGGCTKQVRLADLSPDLPAHGLSWQDAKDYVQWLSDRTGRPYRLPSEAEWEYVARAGATTRFWWGEEVGSGNANCSTCGGDWTADAPHPVGSGLANPFGVHETSGGVMEWVEDCWLANYDGAPDDGSARQQEDCERRVLRGGSWQNDHTYATVTSRLGYGPGVRYVTNGFRVARDLG